MDLFHQTNLFHFVLTHIILTDIVIAFPKQHRFTQFLLDDIPFLRIRHGTLFGPIPNHGLEFLVHTLILQGQIRINLTGEMNTVRVPPRNDIF